MTEIGEVENEIFELKIYDENGKDVTSNYNVELIPGKLVLL